MLTKVTCPVLQNQVGKHMNDPISDCLTRVKNGYMAKKQAIVMPYSNMKKAILEVLFRHGFIGAIEVKGEVPKKSLDITLLYENKTPKLTDIEIVSKPGRRVYIPAKKIPKVLGGMGITVLSTPQGVLSGSVALKKKIGGELICKIW